MTSISTQSPSYNIYIDNMRNGSYRVSDERAREGRVGGDADGDGVIDGESLVGDSGKVVNADGLNAYLKARGIDTVQASGAQLNSPDGFAITSATAPIVTSSDPVLPPVSGPVSSASALDSKLGWAGQIEDGALMWMAMSEMAKVAQREMHDAKEIRNAMQKGKIDAKTAEINANEARIEAERKSAATEMWIQIGTAVATFAISAASYDSTGGSATKAGFQAAAPAIAQAGGAVAKYWNKASGPQAEADEKQVEAMRWQREQEIYDQGIEEARGNYDEAREQFKLALKIMSEHVERQSQVVQKITS